MQQIFALYLTEYKSYNVGPQIKNGRKINLYLPKTLKKICLNPIFSRASQDFFPGGGIGDQMGDKVLCPEQGVGIGASLCQNLFR